MNVWAASATATATAQAQPGPKRKRKPTSKFVGMWSDAKNGDQTISVNINGTMYDIPVCFRKKGKIVKNESSNFSLPDEPDDFKRHDDDPDDHTGGAGLAY